jgi:hypothetical protein
MAQKRPLSGPTHPLCVSMKLPPAGAILKRRLAALGVQLRGYFPGVKMPGYTISHGTGTLIASGVQILSFNISLNFTAYAAPSPPQPHAPAQSPISSGAPCRLGGKAEILLVHGGRVVPAARGRNFVVELTRPAGTLLVFIEGSVAIQHRISFTRLPSCPSVSPGVRRSRSALPKAACPDSPPRRAR